MKSEPSRDLKHCHRMVALSSHPSLQLDLFTYPGCKVWSRLLLVLCSKNALEQCLGTMHAAYGFAARSLPCITYSLTHCFYSQICHCTSKLGGPLLSKRRKWGQGEHRKHLERVHNSLINSSTRPVPRSCYHQLLRRVSCLKSVKSQILTLRKGTHGHIETRERKLGFWNELDICTFYLEADLSYIPSLGPKSDF